MTGIAGVPAAVPAERSGRRSIVFRFLRRPRALVACVIVLLFLITAVFAPIISPFDPSVNDFNAVRQAPSATHLLGTDELGRDLLSRIIHGSRASLTAGVCAALIALVVAVPLGLVAGYYRGFADTVIGRLVDTVLAFPFLILAIGLAAVLGPSLLNATIAIGVSHVPQLIRIVRGEVLAAREEEYVAGAIASGSRDRRILFRHILPNTTNTLLVQATVVVPTAILGEAALSFLGLGVQPPTPSWGVLLSTAQSHLEQAPWLSIFPGLAVMLAALSFNMVADGLRDVLDPKGTR
ncbi:ABC transporter permease [Nonomuraea sp. K274]|uniref:ABC transporter permease n=1 Tax=Nonomuraea cypriaca TaxID=1187855 RepID=A0A931AD38_9ACTN|nr:ABC transporter permease [Nonomuraea cypriaca]MBF8190636.1 ABC transporter permease [Nonomuraea cypriaca]